MALSKFQRRHRIKKRVKKKIRGTKERPRLTVYRSNRQIYAQVINDDIAETLASSGSLTKKKAQKVNRIEQAKMLGKDIAEKAKKAGIDTVVFDRNGYLYHGRVKSLAEGAREGGLKF